MKSPFDELDEPRDLITRDCSEALIEDWKDIGYGCNVRRDDYSPFPKAEDVLDRVELARPGSVIENGVMSSVDEPLRGEFCGLERCP